MIRAVIVNDVDEHRETPGAIDYCATSDGESTGFGFICPCGCGRQGYLPIRRAGEVEIGPSWDWDGNQEAPTLTPSVLQVGGCQWHGYLTNGEWRPC
ncbi:hypothetical protein BBAL3_1642 [Brevundimonas sp. BAL3]|uniref:DUF6527 family protein n=1 Tax=Brevundimonas sp. BAL3 TaxID=391600 RepID=UPI00017EB719|nr:DUF6527 family protein [Brevundimonas sp. BAL3]EDX80485.1 hypothetical protein BBAL3_1642 [Brevundimonas sp. BAL3]